MSDVSELLKANLHDVFGNRDAGARRAAIERIYTEDVEFIDPDEVVRGWDALEAKASGLLDEAPATFAFVADGTLYESADRGALAWTFGPAGQPVARGIDIIRVRGGRIASLETLLAPNQAV